MPSETLTSVNLISLGLMGIRSVSIAVREVAWYLC